MGVVPSKVRSEEEDRRCKELLFLLTQSDEDKESLNCAQVAAAILGGSRVIFYDHLRLLCNYLDPSRAELCYIGESAPFSF